jgi:hypothetical protein
MEPNRSPIDNVPAPPLQFSIRGLMILQAVCAAFLSLLYFAGAFAILAALIATVVYAAIHVSPTHRPVKRLIIDVMGGFVLPAACFYYDPGILRRGGEVGIFPVNLANDPVGPLNWFSMGLQLIVLVGWLAAGRHTGMFRYVFSGALWVGCLQALAIGTLLLPLSLIGIIAAGIGLLGMTPLLTAAIFGRNAAAAASGEGPWTLLTAALWWLGVALALAIPLLLYLTLGTGVTEWLDRLPTPNLLAI